MSIFARHSGWLWLATCFALSAAWCVTAGRELGPTFDEPFYLHAGLHSWHTWHQKDLLTAGTMPLPAKLVTLPLVGWELFHGERLDVLSHMDDWLPIARAMTLVFWLLLLLGGYLGGRLWSGELAGCLAVAFLAVEPILLGHASLATTDLAFTACLLLTAAAFKAGRDGPHRRRITIPAVLCAVTLLAKASAIVFIPVVLVAVEVEHRWQLGQLRDRAAWKQSARDLFAIGWRGLLVVFVLCPFAFLAFRLQFEHNIAGHGMTFLLGEASVDGFWYYFPAALAIKTSLALLVLLALFLIRPRYLANGPMLAALALLLLSPAFRVQIGVRFVLPVIAFAILGLAIALARWFADCPSPSLRRISWGTVAIALGWTITQSLHAWPQGLCYTNELFGGTEHGYLALSDSNYDWGQGLPELARWHERHAEAPLDVWYFGTDGRVKQSPFHAVDVSQSATWEQFEERFRGHYLAVGTSMLYQNAYSTPAAKMLREQTARCADKHIFDLRFHRSGIEAAAETVIRCAARGGLLSRLPSRGDDVIRNARYALPEPDSAACRPIVVGHARRSLHSDFLRSCTRFHMYWAMPG